MSITITVRPNGTTTGGKNQEIPGDGEIDTRAEAEAALAFLPDGSSDTVVVGERTYTRAQLLELRDKGSAAPADPVSVETVAGDGVSHGFYLQGKYMGGLGQKGHSGGGVNLGYVPGITLMNGTGTRLFLDPSFGFTAGHSSASYKTPGGEAVDSAFTNYGGSGGVALRVVPGFLDHRLFFSAGPSIGVGGFSTADSTTVSTPKNCTPGDFGRSECEPSAGPRTGSSGATGLMNFEAGSARGTSGVFVDPALDITAGVDIVRGDWGNIQGTLTFDVGQMILAPSDGNGFSYTHVGGLLGIRGNFGGGAVEKAPAAPVAAAVAAPAAAPAKADRDDDGVPDDVDACPDEKGVKSADPKKNGCPAFKVTWTVLQTYPAGARPAINDILMVGQDKLEGVTYYIEAFDSTTKKLLGTLDSKTINDSITLEKGKPQFLAFVSPEKGGLFKRQNNYFVTLMDKDGKPLTDRKGFTVAETIAGKPAPRGRGMN